MILELVLLVLLALVNAVLTAGEMALAAAPVAALEARGAQTALRLALNPRPLQAAVQVGVTTLALLAGALAGVTLGLGFSRWLSDLGVPPPAAQPAGVIVVVALIALLMLVVGELVARQLALRQPAAIAARLAPVMALYVRLAGPAVAAVEGIGRALLAILGQGGPVPTDGPAALIGDAATEASLAVPPDLAATDLMTPLASLASIGPAAGADEIGSALQRATQPYVVVIDADRRPLGFVGVGELVRRAATTFEHGSPLPLTEVPPVGAAAPAAQVVTALRTSPAGLVPVIDGDGSLLGIVSPEAILRRAERKLRRR